MPLTDIPGVVSEAEVREQNPHSPVSQWDQFQAARGEESANQKTADEIPFSELVNRSVGLDHLIPQVMSQTERHGFPTDPDWSLPESVFDDLEDRGLPPFMIEELETVFSQEEYDFILNRLEEREATKALLAGGRGMAARFLANAIDPVGFAMDAVTGPLAVAKGAGRVRNFARAGVVAGSVNATITAGQAVTDPTISASSLLLDFAAGATLGGAIGSLTGGRLNEQEYSRLFTAVRQAAEKNIDARSAGAAAVQGRIPIDDGLDINIGNIESKTYQTLVDEAYAEAGKEAFFTTGFFRKLRQELAGSLEKSESPVVRRLKRLWTQEPVGFKGNATNEFSATERAARIQTVTGAKFREGYETGLKGFLGDTVKGKSQRLFSITARDEFAERVGRAIRGADDADPHVMRAAQSGRDAFADILERMQQAGVKGSIGLDVNPRYMPRITNETILMRVKEVLVNEPEADTFLQKLISKGIKTEYQRLGKDFDEELTDKVARAYTVGYLKRSVSALKNTDAQNRINSVNEGYLEDVLQAAEFDPDAIEGVLEQFRLNDGKTADGGDFDRLKPRLLMDENVSLTLKNGEEVFLRDLFDNNIERVLDHYTREASGRIALAQAGFRSEADADAVLEALEDEIRTGVGGATPEDLKKLKLIKNHLMGRSLEDDPAGTWSKVGRTIRDQNFLMSMGSVGFSMLAEMGTMIGYAGFRATMKQVPAMRAIWRQALKGEIEPGLARELANMTGVGTSLLRNPVNIRPEELGMKGLEAAWKSVDNGMQAAKKAQVYLSGMGPMHDIMQHMSSRAMTQRLYDFASGATRLNDATKARLRDYGLSDELQTRLFTQLREHAVVDRNGTLKALNVDQWSDPQVVEAASDAIFRATRHIVQEHDIGATFGWMHKAGGKIMSQFRTFSMAAYTRHTLHGIARHDAQTAITVMGSMLFAGLGYMARVNSAYANDEKRRKELLEPERIALSAFQASAPASIVPMMIDTAWNTVLNQEPVFGSAGRSTSLAADAVNGIPTVALYQKAMTAAGIPAAILDPNQEVTKQEIEAALKLVWLSNIAGARSVIREIGDEFPDQ